MAQISIPLLAAQFALKVVDHGLAALCQDNGISRAEWLILTALVGGESYRTTHLAHIVGLQQPTATKAVDRLVSKKLAVRGQDTDRRVVMVSLTSSGRTMGRALINEWENSRGKLAQLELARVLEAGKRLIQAPPS